MGMTFNLGNTSGTAIMRLKAWNIYTVVFKGIVIEEGTKDGKTWKAMRVKFSGEDGIFEPLIFCPGQDGDKRNTGETNGKKWELPSSMENLMYTVAHLGEQLSPERFEKMKKVAYTIPDQFNDLVAALNKVLAPAVDKSTKLKLTGNSKGYATLPNFISINKEGGAFISNNWLGDTVAFTDYEVKQKQNQKTATPTKMKDSEAGSSDDADSQNEDLDFTL